jgi:NAD+ synthase
VHFSSDILELDAQATIDDITAGIRMQVLGTLKRRGAVIGMSGGIDSSVCAALCKNALGKENVLGVLMPERDSSSESLSLGKILADQLGIRTVVENIAPVLEAVGCYDRQVEAIRKVFPEYGPGWKSKIVLPSILEGDRLNVSRLTVQLPSGEIKSERMPVGAYLQLVAATNFKQRTRKVLEYYHADRLNYAVCGTPNRLEYDQGFFVKGGDGAADIKPIAHLYKTQVYKIGKVLGLPGAIISSTPNTDTFSLPQSQEEFYFALPYEKLDLCLYAYNHGISSETVAPAVGLTPVQVQRVYKDIEAKRRGTRYLQMPPLFIEHVREIHEELVVVSESNGLR